MQQSHQRECPYRVLCCPFAGCKVRRKEKDLAAHKLYCPQRNFKFPKRAESAADEAGSDAAVEKRQRCQQPPASTESTDADAGVDSGQQVGDDEDKAQDNGALAEHEQPEGLMLRSCRWRTAATTCRMSTRARGSSYAPCALSRACPHACRTRDRSRTSPTGAAFEPLRVPVSCGVRAAVRAPAGGRRARAPSRGTRRPPSRSGQSAR